MITKEFFEKISILSNEKGELFRNRWIFFVNMFIVFTIASSIILYLLTRSCKPSVVIATIIWANFFGYVILYFFPEKLTITIFGSLLGLSANQIGTGSSLISEVNKTILSYVVQVREARLMEGMDIDDRFITIDIWLFLIILLLICLPVFAHNAKKN